MKKKVLAAVLAAMTVSAASAMAAPALSGDARIEYQKNEIGSSIFDNRIRLNVDTNVDNLFDVHARAVMEKDLNGTGNYAFDFDQAYIGTKYQGVNIKAGLQPLFLGKGLLADYDGIKGLSLGTTVEGLELSGLVGKDNVGNNNVTAISAGTSVSGVNLGASYLKNANDKFYGVTADTKVASNVTLSGEYVKNDTASADGYLAEVKFGDAVKKGDISYAVSYRNIEDNAIIGAYSTNSNYADSKGFKLQADYKVSDNATLTVYQDFVKAESTDADKKRTDVEFRVKF